MPTKRALRPRRRRPLAVLTLSILALIGANLAISSPAASEDSSNHVAWFSRHYLMTKYGVSDAEAMRRMQLQWQVPRLDKKLSERFPHDYGGIWIDQAGGGIARVGMTNPALLTDGSLSGFSDKKHITAVKVQYSLQQLEETSAKLDHNLGAGLGRPINTSIDVPHNVVVLAEIGKSPTALGKLPKLENSSIADQFVVHRHVDGDLKIGDVKQSQASKTSIEPNRTCDPITCGPSMRGGLRLNVTRDDGTVGGCTNGFNVTRLDQNDSSTVDYMLTAGHCVLGDRHSGVQHTTHNGIEVGKEVEGTAFEDDSYPLDFALMPYETNDIRDYWLNESVHQHQILSTCVSSAGGCIDGDLLDSGSYEQLPSVGTVMCATGSSSTSSEGPAGWVDGTRCGEVESGGDGGIRTNICSRKGDSGGPLFWEAGGGGYATVAGILHDGTDTNSATCGSNEYSDYAPWGTIHSWLNQMQPGYDFWVEDIPGS